jgi:hypothetical protein
MQVSAQDTSALQEPGRADPSVLIEQRLTALSERELELYERLKKAGYDAADAIRDPEKGVLVPADIYERAAGLSGPTAVASKLSKLEREGKIEREKDINNGRRKNILLTFEAIPFLVKGSKKRR